MVKHISKIAYGSDVYYVKDVEARSALIDKSEKGATSGVATLDEDGLIPYQQMPNKVSSAAYVAYGTCSTEANVAAKVVTLSNANWECKTGSIIGVKFVNTNTVDSDSENIITLNVNNNGAVSISYDGSANPEGTNPEIYGRAGDYIFYMFDGTYWVWLTTGYIVDTKNTAGSTNTSNKIYLIGATSQTAESQTYS